MPPKRQLPTSKQVEESEENSVLSEEEEDDDITQSVSSSDYDTEDDDSDSECDDSDCDNDTDEEEEHFQNEVVSDDVEKTTVPTAAAKSEQSSDDFTEQTQQEQDDEPSVQEEEPFVQEEQQQELVDEPKAEETKEVQPEPVQTPLFDDSSRRPILDTIKDAGFRDFLVQDLGIDEIPVEEQDENKDEQKAKRKVQFQTLKEQMAEIKKNYLALLQQESLSRVRQKIDYRKDHTQNDKLKTKLKKLREQYYTAKKQLRHYVNGTGVYSHNRYLHMLRVLYILSKGYQTNVLNLHAPSSVGLVPDEKFCFSLTTFKEGNRSRIRKCLDPSEVINAYLDELVRFYQKLEEAIREKSHETELPVELLAVQQLILSVLRKSQALYIVFNQNDEMRILSANPQQYAIGALRYSKTIHRLLVQLFAKLENHFNGPAKSTLFAEDFEQVKDNLETFIAGMASPLKKELLQKNNQSIEAYLKKLGIAKLPQNLSDESRSTIIAYLTEQPVSKTSVPEAVRKLREQVKNIWNNNKLASEDLFPKKKRAAKKKSAK